MKTLFKITLSILAPLVPAVAWAQISGLEFLNIPADAKIGDVIAALYVYGVGFVALAALIVFTAGGVMYIFAGDKDPSKAKEWMKNAFWGLVLALTSWLILYTINPALVKNVGDLKLQTISVAPGPPPAGQKYVCSKESGGYDSFELCKSRCDSLGGTCALHNEQQENNNDLPFCARRGIGSPCQRMSVAACSNIGGWSFPSQSSGAEQSCLDCVRRLNNGEPLSVCTR